MREIRPGSLSELETGGVSELGAGGMRELEARLWTALTEVEDPEIPVSVVGLGLIVSLYYDADERVADVELTFTSMGCPAMEFIQDDIRERLLCEPEVEIENSEM